MNNEILYKRANLMRSGYERKYAMLFRALLNRQFRAVASKINETNYTHPPVSVITEEPMKRAYLSLYGTVGVAFARDSYKNIKERGEDELIDKWEQQMREYAAKTAGGKITSITSMTKDQIRSIVGGAVDRATTEGLGAAETARIIRSELNAQGEAISSWRSLRIARTEVMTASNTGSLVGAKELDVPMDKIWIATVDGRTRPDHIEMNNVAVDINETFELPDGSNMQCPGDPAGGPEQTINCRCTIAYKVKRGEQPVQGGREPGEGITFEEPPLPPERVVFKPAQTISDAEVYADKFANVVDYSGYGEMDLQAANSVNKTLTELHDKYNLDKLNKIIHLPIDNCQARYAGKEMIIGSSDGLRAMFGKNINRIGEHSAFYFDDAIEACIRHEMGHLLPKDVYDKIVKLFSEGIAYERWKVKFGITARAKDTIWECMAENFTLFSKGMYDKIDPELLAILKTLEK